MKTWQRVWRHGIAPSLSTPGLEALAEAIRTDDPKLIQNQNTDPLSLECWHNEHCNAACAIGYAAWKGDKKETVGEVEEAFALACHDADNRLSEPAGVRWFLNWFDDTPREEMRRELLPEVEKVIAQRKETQP